MEVMERSRTGTWKLVLPLVASRNPRTGTLRGEEDRGDGGFATRVLLQQHFRLLFGGRDVEHLGRGSPFISYPTKVEGHPHSLLATEAEHPQGSPTGITVTSRPSQPGGDTEPGGSRLSFAGGYEGKLIRSRN